jgi:hypothetical protein
MEDRLFAAILELTHKWPTYSKQLAATEDDTATAPFL